jgi:glycosyltransferase involved in cell wall biosynthesis
VITVVIPTYNDPADRLERTVTSALASVDRDRGDEIIVVNDGGSTVYVEGVRIIDRDENGGPSAALNAGYAAAQGRYIARLDCGDVFYPEAKRRQFEAVIEQGIAASFSHSVNELTGEVWPISQRWTRQICRDGQFRASTTVVRRDVWERVKWNEQRRRLGDWGWTLRVHHVEPWQLFDEVTGTATAWPGGYSDRASAEEIKAARLEVWRMAQQMRRDRQVQP